MGRYEATKTSTQQKYPWRTMVRGIVQFVVAISAAAPVIYLAITNESDATATGAAAVALGVFAAITRLMAVPAFDEILKRFVPWLASEPKD